jgi:hypothetical protein
LNVAKSKQRVAEHGEGFTPVWMVEDILAKTGRGNGMMLETFYTESSAWHQKIGDIHALLERVKISEERSADALHLRKLNRIMSIHASTAIEGARATGQRNT